MTDPEDALDTFAAVARALAQEDDLETTLQRIVDLAVETVPGAAHAAVSAVRRREAVTTVAASSELVSAIDAVQYETQQGPCLDAIFEQEVVEVDDLSTTDRWPAFSRRAADLGVRSMLSFRLFVEEDVAGALNLYNGDPSGFGERSHRLGHVFAAHAALAWDHEREVAGLRTSVESRTLIGQAQGLLMALHGVTADGAFSLLREVSQRRNRKLRDVAQEVVDAGGLS